MHSKLNLEQKYKIAKKTNTTQILNYEKKNNERLSCGILMK